MSSCIKGDGSFDAIDVQGTEGMASFSLTDFVGMDYNLVNDR